MAERRIGFIPNALDVSQQSRCVFVTDTRTIEVVEETPKSLKEEFRATFGRSPSENLELRPKVDFATVDIDSLTSVKGNTSIRHMSIEKLKVGKGIGGYGIWMTYRPDGEKANYLVLDLTPPKELIRKRKSEGVSARETRRRYAMRCQEVYRKALPPIVAEKVDWRI